MLPHLIPKKDSIEVLINKVKNNDSDLIFLDLTEYQMSETLICDLILALQSNRTITKLEISNYKLGTDSAVALVNVLENNFAITDGQVIFAENNEYFKNIIKGYFTRNKELAERFIEAASKGQLEVIKNLYDQGVSLHYQDKNGNTALHAAAIYGDYLPIQFLLEKGVPPEWRNNNCKTFRELITNPALSTLVKQNNEVSSLLELSLFKVKQIQEQSKLSSTPLQPFTDYYENLPQDLKDKFKNGSEPLLKPQPIKLQLISIKF